MFNSFWEAARRRKFPKVFRLCDDRDKRSTQGLINIYLAWIKKEANIWILSVCECKLSGRLLTRHLDYKHHSSQCVVFKHRSRDLQDLWLVSGSHSPILTSCFVSRSRLSLQPRPRLSMCWWIKLHDSGKKRDHESKFRSESTRWSSRIFSFHFVCLSTLV